MTQPQLGRTRHQWLVDDIIASILNLRSCANRMLEDIDHAANGHAIGIVRLALEVAELQKHLGTAMQTAKDMQLLIQQAKDENEAQAKEIERLRAEVASLKMSPHRNNGQKEHN